MIRGACLNLKAAEMHRFVFTCNFSIRLVNLEQQPYKSCSFAQAGDQVLRRMILGEKNYKEKKKEEGELGQLCTSDGRYFIL